MTAIPVRLSVFRKGMIALAAWMPLAVAGAAAELAFVGILGNSGAPDQPVQILVDPEINPRPPLASGVWVDPDGRLYLGGGAGLNVFNPDGTLHRTFPLRFPRATVNTRSFTPLDGFLYFFGNIRAPGRVATTTLFRLRLDDDQAEIEAVADFPEYPHHLTGVLADAPRDGRLLFGHPVQPPPEDGKRVAVSGFDPATKERNVLFELPGESLSSVSVAPDGQALFVGGYFGAYVPSRIDPGGHEILKLDWDGHVRWRREAVENKAEPTVFRGIVSAVGDAVWDFAWYGFTARFRAADGAAAPGRLTAWDMRIPYINQLADARAALGLPPLSGRDALAVAGVDPRNAYLAEWDDRRGELKLLDGGELVRLEVDGFKVTEKDRRDGDWSAKIRLAADGAFVLLSDAENHRVMLLDAENLEVLSLFGDAGKAGAGVERLNAPTGLALSGNRAVVADTGNQRLVKLRITE